MTTKKQVNGVLQRCKGGAHKRKDKRATRATQKHQDRKEGLM